MCNKAYSFFFKFSLWSALFEVPQECPLAQDNNHISVWSSLSSRHKDEFTSRTAGTGILFFWELTHPAPLHIYPLRLTAGNFPRRNCATARHDRWLLYPQSLPQSDPDAIYFCQHPRIFDVPKAHTGAAESNFHPFSIPAGVKYTYRQIIISAFEMRAFEFPVLCSSKASGQSYSR